MEKPGSFSIPQDPPLLSLIRSKLIPGQGATLEPAKMHNENHELETSAVLEANSLTLI